MRQVGRTLSISDEGILVGYCVLICDRDSKWSAPVRERLGEVGIRVVQTVSGAERQCLCRTVRAFDQTRVSQLRDPVR
jgi:hypothetical protein